MFLNEGDTPFPYQLHALLRIINNAPFPSPWFAAPHQVSAVAESCPSFRDAAPPASARSQRREGAPEEQGEIKKYEMFPRETLSSVS